MHTKPHTHTRVRTLSLHNDGVKFVVTIACIIFAALALDSFMSSSLPSAAVRTTAAEADTQEIVDFSADVVTSLSAYYDAIGDSYVNPANKVDVFASVVANRGAVQKLNEHMSMYLLSTNQNIVSGAEHIVASGRLLENSYTHIIDAMSGESQASTTLVMVEQMYLVNDALFNLTMTSVNTVAYFTAPDAVPLLSPRERKYISDTIWNTFGGPDSSTDATTTSSRALLLHAFTGGQNQ